MWPYTTEEQNFLGPQAGRVAKTGQRRPVGFLGAIRHLLATWDQYRRFESALVFYRGARGSVRRKSRPADPIRV